MEFTQVLSERRSIRHYASGRKVPRELVEQMIEAAICAPSWKNSQTSRYHVVMSEEMTAAVKEKCLPEFNARNAQNAPVLIVTTFEKNNSGYNTDGTPTNELGNGWGIYDLGLHDENLILKARDLGLDTLIMGIRDIDKLRELLDIGENEAIVSVIAVGYTEERPVMPKRKAVSEVAKFY